MFHAFVEGIFFSSEGTSKQGASAESRKYKIVSRKVNIAKKCSNGVRVVTR